MTTEVSTDVHVNQLSVPSEPINEQKSRDVQVERGTKSYIWLVTLRQNINLCILSAEQHS